MRPYIFSMIELKNVSKIYENPHQEALPNINLIIKDGEFVAIIGPSGSGKTTLLNIIGGLDKPEKGEVIINEINLNKLTDKKLSAYRNQYIGFVFQEFHLQKNLNTEENVTLPLIFGKKKIDSEKIKEILNEVGLQKHRKKKTAVLSGGEKQRVAIARALINNPKIILADEPTGNLDESTGQKILNLLQKIHKEHKVTLIIATHDQRIANTAERTVHLKTQE